MTTNASTSSANGPISLALGLLAAALVFMILTGRDVLIVGNGAGVLLALAVIMLVKVGLMSVERFIA